MAYPPDKWTDDALDDLENRIAEVYRDAAKDLDKEVKAYFAKFEARDKEMKKLVASGDMTQAEYQKWRTTQIGRGKRFEDLRDKMAERFTQANEIANAYVNDATPNLYSLNRNYEAYTIEKTVGACDFNLMDESTVRRLLIEQPDLMPYYPPNRALNRGIDLEYGKSQITKHVTSGVIRGISPGKIANELMSNMENMNRTSAVRAARTGITAAQNGGRMDSYVAAEKMGIKIRRRWICTKDARTRLDHGLADGQIVEGTKEPFKVGGYKMMFPADASLGAPGFEIYNCRCTTRTVEKDGIEAEPRQTRVRNPAWEEAKAQEDELTNRVEKLKEREQKETDPEAKKRIRQERLKTQKELSEATAKRQSVDKNVLVTDMNYSEWQKWKQTGVKPEPPKFAPTTKKSAFKAFTEGEDAKAFFGQRPDRALRRSNREQYDSQMEAYRNSMFGSWYDGLTSDEYSAIAAYTGDDYSGINGLLRNEMTEKMVNAWNSTSQQTIQEKIENITNAIGRFDLTEPIRVYRTCEEDVFDNLKKQVGSLFIDDGFTSTSVLPAKVASGNVRMVIDVPSGNGVGAWVNPLSGAEDEEWEFLLQRGTQFQIDGIEEVDGETCIRMTVVGNEQKKWAYASREKVEEMWKRRGLWDDDSENQI